LNGAKTEFHYDVIMSGSAEVNGPIPAG
jgi:hypothetical protein